jgi:KDO2-lipid IV(A) lauroyltransferase
MHSPVAAMIEFIEFVFFLILRQGARLLSFRSAGIIGALLGGSVYRLTGVRKNITFENLAKALPELTEHERETIARGAYRNYGIAIMEMLWAGAASEEAIRKTVRVRNPEVFANLKAQNKGVILLSGHFGSWELLISGLRLQLGVPFTIIVQHQRNTRIDALVDRNRRRFGNVTVPMGPSVREVLKALRESRVVAMLGDQSGPKESVFVEFFGRPAATHRGPAAFSLRTGAPIMLAFLRRQQDGTYEAVCEEVDQSGLSGYSEENIRELTRRHTAALEQQIREFPDHWLWMHKRWKHTDFYEALERDASVGVEQGGR